MDVDDWSPTLALERFELLRRVWELGNDAGADQEGSVLAPQLRLRPDRRVACGVAPDLAFWDVRGDALVLLDRVGRATVRFDEIERADDRTLLRGARLADPSRALTLRETDPIETWPAPDARHVPQPREELVPRRHLVVADAAGFAQWTADLAHDDRSWDLCLLGTADDEEPSDCEYEVAPTAAGRWAALHTLLYPRSPLFRYDLVAFPDSFVRWSWAGANEAFAIAHAHDLALSHPTIAAGTLAAARFRPVPGRLLGFGTPVELLCPIFSAEALRVCAPSFALAPEGAPELAQLWTALLAAPRTRIAVIDGAPPITAAGAPPPPGMPDLLARYGLAPAACDAGALLDA